MSGPVNKEAAQKNSTEQRNSKQRRRKGEGGGKRSPPLGRSVYMFTPLKRFYGISKVSICAILKMSSCQIYFALKNKFVGLLGSSEQKLHNVHQRNNHPRIPLITGFLVGRM